MRSDSARPSSYLALARARLGPWRFYHGAILLWLLGMICMPITLWVWGEDLLRVGVTATVLLQVAAVTAILAAHWPARRLVWLFLLVLPATWLIEWFGSTTGWPFGDYYYTDRLTPQIGHVPAIIPLAWLMMLPPSWAVASRISGRTSGLRFALISGLVFMAWDLFLDPQMVGWGYWAWEDPVGFPGGYFGIPWGNFGGWVLGAAAVTELVTRVIRLDPVPIAPLMGIYIATWLLETGGQAVLWNLPGPALAGFLGMGLCIALALRADHP